METLQRISRTELARNTRRVLDDVQRGRTTLVENYGQPEAALLDIVDYQILRAVVRAYGEQPQIPPDDTGLSEEVLEALDDDKDRYGLVFGQYLAGSISLARAAELLHMPALELRTRCLRLNVPIRTSPRDTAEAVTDIETAARW